MKQEITVADQCERDAGIRDGMDAELLLNMGKLRLFRTEKFSPGRHIVKQSPGFHCRAMRSAIILYRADAAAVDFDLRAGERPGFPRGETKVRHACDARQSFAAESERADGGQILLAPDFARRVALDTQQRIFATHAAAIVGHADECGTSSLHTDFDARCAGVQTVLHQFPHDCRRTLHHFTGRDLRGQCVGHDANSAHRV